MQNNQLSTQSMEFAVAIIDLVKKHKSRHESVISSQIGRSGTSVSTAKNNTKSATARLTAEAMRRAKIVLVLRAANYILRADKLRHIIVASAAGGAIEIFFQAAG